jgi:hypothetical protein
MNRLGELLREGDGALQRVVLSVAWRLRDEQKNPGFPLLSWAVANGEPRTRASALNAMSLVTGLDEVPEFVVSGLDDPDLAVRRAAVNAVLRLSYARGGRSALDRAAATLVDMIETCEEPLDRYWAVEILALCHDSMLSVMDRMKAIHAAEPDSDVGHELQNLIERMEPK